MLITFWLLLSGIVMVTIIHEQPWCPLLHFLIALLLLEGEGLSILLRTINKTLYVCLLVLVNILALVAKRTPTALSSRRP